MVRTKKKSKFDNKFKSFAPSDLRKENLRSERKVKEDMPKLCLNFKDFDMNQCPPGQTFENWEEEGRLSVLMKKFVDICMYNRTEAMQMKFLKVYGDFPENSDFHKPNYIEGDVEWGTLQRIGGQKPRLAGYIIDNIFSPGFRYKEHRFYPSSK